jgi:uncharacterized integral membrane protein
MSNKKTSSCSLLGVGFITFIIFLILKLTNTIDWSWIWVTCPLWSVPLISLAFLGIGFGITMLALVITVLNKKK